MTENPLWKHKSKNNPRETFTIQVKRSDGRIDPGWTVAWFDLAAELVIVTKEEGKRQLQKRIPLSQLKDLNQISENDISKA